MPRLRDEMYEKGGKRLVVAYDKDGTRHVVTEDEAKKQGYDVKSKTAQAAPPARRTTARKAASTRKKS